MKTTEAMTRFLQAKDLSLRTQEQYSWALDYLSHQCEEMPREPGPLRQALSKLPTPWTKDACWRVWRSFFRWCSLEYQIPDVMDRVQRPKVPHIEMRALEPADLSLVLATATDPRQRAILALALDSGVRASEFGRLHVLDVTSDTIRIWGKGSKQVRVPLSPDTHYLLQPLINDAHGPQSLLFPDQRGQPLSRFAVYKVVRRCMDRAGIPGPKRGPHCLRHSLGMNFIADGGDPFSLKRIMRHNNIATTQKYVNLAMHTVVEQHHLHSPLKQALRGAQGVLIKRDVIEEAQSILGR